MPIPYKKKQASMQAVEPLAGPGIRILRPPNFITVDRAPNTRDFDNYKVGDEWTDRTTITATTADVWKLVKKTVAAGSVKTATWVNLRGGQVGTLTGDLGGAVSPDAADNISLLGTADVVVTTGNPATNTITWSLGGHVATSYLADDTNSAVPAAGVLTVTGAHGLNTTAPGSASTISTQIDNTITLGDLAVLTGTTPALTCTTGGITLSGSTATLATCPVINCSSNSGRIAFLFNDTYVGPGAGNLTASHTTGIFNTGIGTNAISSITSGQRNTAIGHAVLRYCEDGISNTCAGYVAGHTITSGSSNIFIGHEAGLGVTTGSYNISIQSPAAADLTTADSNNIHIGTTGGHGGENSTIRIGTHGAATGQQNLCYIAGINGNPIVGGVTMVIDAATHQIGTLVSSIRYKENVQDMGDETQALYKLRPVTFNYKTDTTKSKQYGLIAEEVGEHLERLVVCNGDGQPETVKYHDMPAMLLNELIKHHAKIDHQSEVIKNLKDRLRILEEQISLLLNKMSKE